jgi:hypothetical protein
MDDTRGLGCGWWMIAGALVVLIMAVAMPGDGKSGAGGGGATTNSRTGTASGNQVEVMSRNQLNLWSDVTNCNGDWSCVTVVTTTTSTVQNTTTDTRNTIDGDRNNVVIGSDGARLCEDPVTHIMTTTACEGGQ